MGGLANFIDQLEHENELIRIRTFVDPVYEIAEITDRVSKSEGGGKALLFENTGTGFPLLINAMGSEKRMAMALGIQSLDDISVRISKLTKKVAEPRPGLMDKLRLLPDLAEVSNWMPKMIKGRGACQEVVFDEPDLMKLPILKCWPGDGGRFVTLPLVHTLDPNTAIRNVGMYRMQVFDKQTTGMHWHRHKTGARHYEEYKQAGKRMPVSVVLGGDPVYTYAATAPLPDQIDEFIFAGFLRNKKVELTRCLTNELYVPADADFVIEGYVDQTEPKVIEGPFGDHTGFYSLPDWYPNFHVTCITCRKNAVYPATIVGIPPQEDAYIAKATERIFLMPIKFTMVPEMCEMDIPVAGTAHNLTLTSIRKSYPGQGLKVANSLWGAGQMMFNKIMIVTDDTCDVHNYTQVLEAVKTHVRVERDVMFSRGPLDVLDHAADVMSFGGKMCIDATAKMPEEGTKNSAKPEFDFEKAVDFMTTIEGVDGVSDALIKLDFPGIFVKVRTSFVELVKSQIRANLALFPTYVILIDSEVLVDDFEQVVWLVANNIDPVRDCSIISDSDQSCLVVDGTSKRKGKAGFTRDWPNIITSNDQIITKVDSRWAEYGIGTFIDSPSKRYSLLKKGDGAYAE